MILFLPPAPQTGAFFDNIRGALPEIETMAATYPGYGDVPAGEVSIEAYAASLLPQDAETMLFGFHTGCLVAIEMALQSTEMGALILIDIPYFDDQTKKKYAVGLDMDKRENDAFCAAFAYDLSSALRSLSGKVTCIATQSNLFNPTVKAAGEIEGSVLIERRDIEKPAFGNAAMVELIRSLAL